MAKLSSGNLLTYPGMSVGAYDRMTFLAGASPSAFEEPAFIFSGDDRLLYSVGKRISGQMHQRFNSYQGTLRFQYAPYQNQDYTRKRTLFYLEGSSPTSYMELYVTDGALYFDCSGIAAQDGTIIRRAYMSLGSFAVNKHFHIVARWDFNGMVDTGGTNYYMTLHGESSAAPNNSLIPFPALSWKRGDQKEFAIGNNYLGEYSAEGKIYGMLIDDVPWDESRIVDDYNSNQGIRLSHAVGMDTLFSGPYERQFSTSDYICHGIDKAFIGKERTKTGEPESDYFRFQNKNGNLVQDPYMYSGNINKWTENNVKAGKETNPAYIKTGRHSLKLVRTFTSNTYVQQQLFMAGGGPFSLDFEVYVTKGAMARISVLIGANTVYDSGDITTVGWNKIHGSFAVTSVAGNCTLYIQCNSAGASSDPSVVYYDRIFVTPNHIAQPSFESLSVGVVWRELSAGNAIWTPTGYAEGSSLEVNNTPIGLADAIYQLNLVGHNTDSRYLLLGQMREPADVTSCKPFIAIHQEGAALADRYIIHNFAELSGLCVNSDWQNFGFTFPAPFGNFDYIFQYGLGAVNSYFYLDNLACVELDTIAPATYFSGADTYALDRYGTETGAYLIDGRDVLQFAVSSYFMDTLSGAVLIGFKPNGSWFKDSAEHIFMQYGSGDIVLKKNSSNELELNYNDAVCTLGVTQMSPTKYQFIGASWDQVNGTLSLMGEGSFSVYEGVVTAIASANTVYFGNSHTPTGDTSANAYFDKIDMYALYVDTTSWERVLNYEVFS